MRISVLAFASALSVANAFNSRASYATKEVHKVPAAWKRLDRAPADHKINLNIALKQSHFSELERHLYEVSDPSHVRYGQHLSQDQVNHLIKPSSETSELVHQWLSDHGIESSGLSYSPARDWIYVALPVSTIEHLLNTEYSIWEHHDGYRVVRTPDWSLPRHLHDHVMTIQPTNSFFRPMPLGVGVMPEMGSSRLLAALPEQTAIDESSATVAQVCNTSAVTPLCLRTLYGTLNYQPNATDKNQVALTDYLGEANNRSDIEIFLTQFRPDAAPYAHQFPVTVINNGSNQQTPDTPEQLKAGKDTEGNLDAETIISITYPTPLLVYTTGGSPPFVPDKHTPTNTNEPYMTWLNYVLAQDSLPPVISNSYGDDERTVPLSFATAVCQGFAQLGARGVSVFFGSGDYGVGYNKTCLTNTGTPTRQFTPNFPASCPYVTVVGATQDFSPEIVAYDSKNGFASGGGFSNYFAQPSYQNSTVPQYITGLNGAYDGLYNKSGRGYPDVAAQGEHFEIVWNGTFILIDGTSAATPTFASVIALVNDALLQNNKSTLGFLNPFLYQRGSQALNDIVSGSATGCGVAGFPAKVGWDAVTGFGTPNFTKILQALDLPQGRCPGANCTAQTPAKSAGSALRSPFAFLFGSEAFLTVTWFCLQFLDVIPYL